MFTLCFWQIQRRRSIAIICFTEVTVTSCVDEVSLTQNLPVDCTPVSLVDLYGLKWRERLRIRRIKAYVSLNFQQRFLFLEVGNKQNEAKTQFYLRKIAESFY